VNEAVALGIAAALDELDDDANLVAGVLTGAPPGFCAGMDLRAFVAGESVSAGDRGFAGIVRRASRKPLVAAVEGFAFAGGLELALACDLLVVARDARLGVPEVKRGLVPTGGALRWLPQRLPSGVAMEMALTGEPLDTQRAYDLGLINRLTEPGEALAEAISLAERIAANGPLAVTATKEILKRQFYWGEEEFWDLQDELTEHVFTSRDAREGALAFTEKRQPEWEGQ
jgi:enoyl-CoA hydratase